MLLQNVARPTRLCSTCTGRALHAERCTGENDAGADGGKKMTLEGAESPVTHGGVGEADAEFGTARPHWNDLALYRWSTLCMPQDLDSHIRSFFKGRGCVYRLVGLTEDHVTAAPVTVDRVCGQDQTGTLYIGRAGKPSRLRVLVNSLIERSRRAPYRYYSIHEAGKRIRTNSLLSRKFMPNRLAVTWAFHRDPLRAEAKLFLLYFNSFGEAPPLNRQG
jgi:hypothetical protein